MRVPSRSNTTPRTSLGSSDIGCAFYQRRGEKVLRRAALRRIPAVDAIGAMASTVQRETDSRFGPKGFRFAGSDGHSSGEAETVAGWRNGWSDAVAGITLLRPAPVRRAPPGYPDRPVHIGRSRSETRACRQAAVR